MAEDPQPIDAIFHEALQRSDRAERQAYLRQACGADADLRGQVERLLAAVGEMGDFLNKPVAAGVADNAATLDTTASGEVGQSIGPYKLLQKLGEGGMGVVWLVEQSEPFKRRVALKVIQGGIGSKNILARFESERQALALMNHPNIARILDAGTTPDGQPYFAMELVEGRPLTKYCDDNNIGINQRLELFTQVCSGVQHAHQKGIIHRDLKPGNILVAMIDGKPVPKVIDFGLAKAMERTQRLTEQSLFTGIGQILGTLRYMSPEQASLNSIDIDTRTDIFALGVILYELLTGSTPLDESVVQNQAALKVLELIRDKEPVKPSSKLDSGSAEHISAITGARRTDSVRLSRILSGDLDWIVMKALEKDRTRRYETASGFAADIRRYLNSEPVVARPPSLSYRIQKFVTKNRAGVIAAALLALALVCGIIGTTWGMFRALDAEKLAGQRLTEANQARARESAQRQLAEVRRTEAESARQVADNRRSEAERNLAYAKKGNDILGSVFADLDPSAEYGNVAELRNALRTNLEKAVAQLDGSAIGDPLAVAKMQFTLGQSLYGLGDNALAIALLERARNTHVEILGPEHADTLTCLSLLGLSYKDNAQLDKALPLLEQTFDRRKARFGPDDPDTLTSMNDLAQARYDLGQLDQAIPMLEEVLALRKTRLGPRHLDTLVSMNNLAAGYLAARRPDRALPLFEDALTLMKVELGPKHPETLGTMNNLAHCYQWLGRLDQALPLLEETLAITRGKLGLDHPVTLHCLNNLGTAYADAQQLDKAVPLLEESFELRKGRLRPDDPELRKSINNLAAAYESRNDFEKAIALRDEAVRELEQQLGRDHQETQLAVAELGITCEAAGQLDRGIALLLEAAASQPPWGQLARINRQLRKAYLTANQPEKFDASVQAELVQVRRNATGPVPLASMLTSIGRECLAAAKPAQARELLEEAYSIRHSLNPYDSSTFFCQSLLGQSLLALAKEAHDEKEKNDLLTQAETHLLASYDGLKAQAAKIPPANAARTFSEPLDRLIELYTTLNKPDEVARFSELRKQYPAPDEKVD